MGTNLRKNSSLSWLSAPTGHLDEMHSQSELRQELASDNVRLDWSDCACGGFVALVALATEEKSWDEEERLKQVKRMREH